VRSTNGNEGALRTPLVPKRQWEVRPSSLTTLIDGPQPVVVITGFVSASGRTPCDGSGTIEVNTRFCRLGGKGFLPRVLLHELAHFADCQNQRFPPKGKVEEGAEAERACFGSSLDAKVP